MTRSPDKKLQKSMHDFLYGEPDPTMRPVAPKPSYKSTGTPTYADEDEPDNDMPREMRVCDWCQELLDEDDEGHPAERGNADHYDGVICTHCHSRGVRL